MQVVISVNPTRLAKALEVLRPWFPNVEKFHDCVVGKDVDLGDSNLVSVTARRTVAEATRRSAFEIGTKGTVGCYLSHTNVWKRLLESNHSYAMIFEDDPTLAAPSEIEVFKDGLKKLLERHPDVDVVLFGQTYVPKISKKQFGRFRSVDHVFEGLLGYVITRHGAKALLAEAFPMVEQVDAYIGSQAFLGKASVWAFDTPIIVQSPTQGSSIQDVCISCLMPNDNSFYVGVAVLFVFLTLFLCFRK